MRLSPAPVRSRMRGARTATGPRPVMIARSGRWPWRTSRWRPSSVCLSAWPLRKAATSASTACANSARAPSRRTSVSGSEKAAGWISLTTLSWIMACRSFGGEVEVSNTPTVRWLIPHAVTNFRACLQLASLVGAPAGYLRQPPAPIAGINRQYGLAHHRAEMVKTYTTENGRPELRAVTGPDYGRIHDHELVEAVMRIAGNGTGDTRWKVPGVLDWATMVHNPHVAITKETTTLYASDRDVFLFLVDDTHPIEAGRLADGSPDVYF